MSTYGTAHDATNWSTIGTADGSTDRTADETTFWSPDNATDNGSYDDTKNSRFVIFYIHLAHLHS